MWHKLFNSSNKRNKNLFKSISVSFIAKGLAVLCNFLFVPLTIDYINPTQFGIWLTLSSIIGWVSLLDIGLGNGLKNGLGEAFAKNDNDAARIYTSTTYITLAAFLLSLFIIFISVNWFINWDSILNVPKTYQQQLRLLSAIVLGGFCCQFVLQLVTIIFSADQKYDKVALANFSINFLSLVLILILNTFTSGSLLKLGLVVCASPILVYITLSVIAFTKEYKQLLPSFKYYQFKVAKKLFATGAKFFLIQISLIIIYQLSNLLIAKMYGVEHVTSYNIAQKYLSTVIIVLNIIMAPFWSAFTEAYLKQDFDWIKRAMRNLKRISIAGALLIVLMIFVADPVYSIWIGKSVNVPFSITLYQGIFFIINSLAMPYVFFINGTGKIFAQTLIAIFGIIMFVPLALLFARYYNMGIPGIILASVVCNLPMIIIYPIQYRKLLEKSDAKIWQ
jgi:O-antigen/teichoic acid export membrane protein